MLKMVNSADLRELIRRIREMMPAVMTGAGELVDGLAGLVPQPVKGEQDKYLRGDGTWAAPAKVYKKGDEFPLNRIICPGVVLNGAKQLDFTIWLDGEIGENVSTSFEGNITVYTPNGDAISKTFDSIGEGGTYTVSNGNGGYRPFVKYTVQVDGLVETALKAAGISNGAPVTIVFGYNAKIKFR